MNHQLKVKNSGRKVVSHSNVHVETTLRDATRKIILKKLYMGRGQSSLQKKNKLEAFEI